MQVTYFQRKPRPNANYSIEKVFTGLRHALAGKVDATVCVAPAYSSGILRRCWILWHARRHQGEINHVTGDTTFTALALNGKRTVLTSHDCGYLSYSMGLRRWLFKWFWIRLPVRRVAAVTTGSTQSKEEIIRHTGCAPEKIHVIPHAVPSEFRPKKKPFNCAKPRILHLGTAPNKNLPVLVEAITGIACTLVVVGRMPGALCLQINRAGIELENHVALTSAEIVRQYEQCDLVTFASLYEGFGMPILEAQAVGRPLLTSNRQPMSEVAGEGACLVDPTDPKSIRAGIERIINETDFRARLVERGFKNIERFQPETVSRQYLALYEWVLKQANGVR